MRASRVVIAVLVALVGLVWIGQGSGLIAGSAMSGSPFWLAVGVVLVVRRGRDRGPGDARAADRLTAEQPRAPDGLPRPIGRGVS